MTRLVTATLVGTSKVLMEVVDCDVVEVVVGILVVVVVVNEGNKEVVPDVETLEEEVTLSEVVVNETEEIVVD